MFEKFFLVIFLATREAVALFVNDPIMREKLIGLFRYLECQDPSIISNCIGRNTWFCKWVI